MLPCYLVPDNILDKIFNLARKFLWGKGNNSNGIHYIGWNTTALAKPMGGLGIINLRYSKSALRAKNVLAILNKDDKLWIQIVNHKYGNLDIWNPSTHYKASWFFRMLHKTALNLRANFRINVCNPNTTRFLDDPWLFNIPINRWPTFINMDLPIENFSVSDFLSNNVLNLQNLTFCLSKDLDGNSASNLVFYHDSNNHWTWALSSSSAKISSDVYNFLNQSSVVDHWKGWHIIWKIPGAPQVKTFIWRLLHGRIPTFEFLYSLNIGPQLLCPICNMEKE